MEGSFCLVKVNRQTTRLQKSKYPIEFLVKRPWFSVSSPDLFPKLFIYFTTSLVFSTHFQADHTQRRQTKTTLDMSTQLKVKLMSGEEFFVNVDLNGSVEAAKAAVLAAQSYEEGTKLKLICGKYPG